MCSHHCLWATVAYPPMLKGYTCLPTHAYGLQLPNYLYLWATGTLNTYVCRLELPPHLCMNSQVLLTAGAPLPTQAQQHNTFRTRSEHALGHFGPKYSYMGYLAKYSYFENSDPQGFGFQSPVPLAWPQQRRRYSLQPAEIHWRSLALARKHCWW